MKTATLLIAKALLLAPAFANASDGKGMHDRHDMKAASASKGAAAAAFEATNAKMHKNIMIEMSADADADFMNGLIPHHQGAVDMAYVLLKYGKDPVTSKLAEDIIKAQESEIAMMKDWLAKHQK